MFKNRRSVLSLLLILLMIMSSTPYIAHASADESSALVTTLTGKVTVKLAGGSKTVRAFPDMPISEGDQIITGSDGSVTLTISRPNSVRTIGPGSVATITKLRNHAVGTELSIKLLVGSLWSSVGKIGSSSSDIVETPGADLSVKGTNFLVIVDSDGTLSVSVASGLVDAIFDGEPPNQASILVAPTQQLSVYPTDLPTRLQNAISAIDVKQLASKLDPTLIRAVINSAPSIISENQSFQQELEKSLSGDHPIALSLGDSLADLSIINSDQLQAYVSNIDHLLSNLAYEFVQNAKMMNSEITKLIEEVNKKIPDSEHDIDWSAEHALQPWAGFSSDSIDAKEKERDRLEGLITAKALRLEALKADFKPIDSDLQQISDRKDELGSTNENILFELQQEAETLYVSRLSPEDLADYLQSKKRIESANSSTNESKEGQFNGTPGHTESSPKVVLSKNNTPAGFNISIHLENFTGPNAMYGAEFHFVNSAGISADLSSGRLLNDNYFPSSNSIDALRTLEDPDSTMTETIYVATQFGVQSNVTIANGTLATIPFLAQQDGSLRLTYVKIVDRNAKTILELTDGAPSLPPPIFYNQ